MNLEYIEVNAQSSIKIELIKTIYFDPFKIENESHDADIIFITHSHYDHFDQESIEKIKNDNTIVVAPLTIKNEIDQISFKEYKYLNPFDEIIIEGINIKTVPSYNDNKDFHPRSNNWLGYIVNYDGVTYYVAGDTDATEDAKNVKCDIALIPIGGHYTMDVYEASELLKVMNPKIVIPTHYGSIVGTQDDGKILKKLLKDTDIKVVEKLF